MAPANPIYLDHNATTPLDPCVLEAMLPWLRNDFGNAASVQHVFGRKAKEACDVAREQVAALIGASPREIVFTSGATESNNLALKGLFAAAKRSHFITATTEHPSVLEPLERLERLGASVTRLAVNEYGQIDPAQVAEAINENTLAVSLMRANNEIGTTHPIREIGPLCRSRRVLLHTDAVQAATTLSLSVDDLGADLLSLSAHKMYGPKGVGALFVRRGVSLQPLLDGGGHERGLRSGTLPVPLIVGFGVACELCVQQRHGERLRLLELRDRLHDHLRRLGGVKLNGHPTERLPGNLNVSIEGVRGDQLAVALGASVAVSSGSACTTASVKPSHVLQALGLDEESGHGSVRFGIGRYNTGEDIDRAASEVARVVTRLRAANPLHELTPSPIQRAEGAG